MTHHSTSKLLLAACLLIAMATLPKPSVASDEADEERTVPCPDDKFKCINGGKCTVKVRWSKKNNEIIKNLEDPKCECTKGHSGKSCEVKAPGPAKLSKSGSTALICGLSTVGALLLVLIVVLVYLGYLKRKTSGKQRRQQQQHQQHQQQQQRSSSAGSRSSAASHP